MRPQPTKKRFPSGRRVKKTDSVLDYVRGRLEIRSRSERVDIRSRERIEIEALAICNAGDCDPYPTPYVWVYVFSPDIYGGITSVLIQGDAVDYIQIENQ